MLVILAVCAHAVPKRRGFPQFPGYGTFNPKSKLPVPFPKVSRSMNSILIEGIKEQKKMLIFYREYYLILIIIFEIYSSNYTLSLLQI